MLLTRHAGTGTTAGDKIEAAALNETFCKGRQNRRTLLVGSSKSNVGHTESVAGLVGLIKAVLILEKKMIPPNATFMKPNPDIPLEAWGMEVGFYTFTKLQAETNAFCVGAQEDAEVA